MIRTNTALASLVVIGALASLPSAPGQVPPRQQQRAPVVDSPMARLRPIGSGNMQSRPPVLRETAYEQNTARSRPDSGVRQTVLLQQLDAPPLQGAMPMPGTNPFPPISPPNISSTPQPPATVPRSLPVGPNVVAPNGIAPGNTFVPGSLTPAQVAPPSVMVPSSSDCAPLAPPQLNGGFATISNCNCISPPSSYSAVSGGGCAPVSYQAPQTYVAPPAQIPLPTILPNGFAAPQIGRTPAKALISFGQERNPVVVGPGLFGQPVAYVPGQTFRNGVRYIFP